MEYEVRGDCAYALARGQSIATTLGLARIDERI